MVFCSTSETNEFTLLRYENDTVIEEGGGRHYSHSGNEVSYIEKSGDFDVDYYHPRTGEACGNGNIVDTETFETGKLENGQWSYDNIGEKWPQYDDEL